MFSKDFLMICRTIALLLSILSINLTAQPNLKLQIENRLRHMHVAIHAGNIESIVKQQQHLLRHARKDPDLLWQSYNPHRRIESKLIDYIPPFALALRVDGPRDRQWDQWADHVHSSKLGRSLSGMFSSCLLLSTKSILGLKPFQGYLRQLIDDQDNIHCWPESLQAKLKIQLTVEYLGTATRYHVFTQAASQALPDNLMRVIAVFCFGVTPRTQANTKKEIMPMQARTRAQWHEFGIFSKNRMQEFVDYASQESPFPLSQDKKILRAFVWAGLTEKNLYAQINRPLKGALDKYRRTYWSVTGLALVSLVYTLLPFAARRGEPFTLIKLCADSLFVAVGLFFAGLSLVAASPYCDKKKGRFKERFQSKQQAFLEQWPQLVREINNIRLSFEESIDDLPDIIPACDTP